jgi:hypothetical protein
VTRLRVEGLAVVDLSAIRAEFTLEQFEASRFDRHPSQVVHRRIGEQLSAAIAGMFGDDEHARR